MSNRMIWDLVDNDQVLDFVQWLRKEYPITFKSLVKQFVVKRILALTRS